MRENPRVYGTEGERALLHAEPSGPGPDAVSWYETKAVEFSRLQICVELFVAAHTYADVATLGLLPKITAGQLYFYPGFKASHDGEKLATELTSAFGPITTPEEAATSKSTKNLAGFIRRK